MGRTKNPDEAPAAPGNVPGVKKTPHVFVRRNYDKGKLKVHLSVNQMQSNAVSSEFLPVPDRRIGERFRSVSTSDIPGPSTAPGAILPNTQPTVPVHNSFDILSTDDDAMPATQQGCQNEGKKTVRCPPITVRNKSIADINQMISSLGGDGKFTLRNNSGSVQIRVKCSDLFKQIENCLKEAKVEFFTHSTREEATVKIVLSGLPVFEYEDLVAELEKNNIRPREIKLLSESDDGNSALYLLHFDKGHIKLNTLREVRHLFNVIVWWRYFTKKKSDVIQCYRCQRFGHGSRHCNMMVRCVKCGEQHTSSACKLPRRDELSEEMQTNFRQNVKCANCQQNHTANFKDCPYRKDYLKQQEQKNLRSRLARDKARGSHQSREFTSRYVFPGFSFADSLREPPIQEPASHDGLFTITEFLGLAREMYTRFSKCTTKEEQFLALHELMVKYIYLH